jgi:hypothetical protein
VVLVDHNVDNDFPPDAIVEVLDHHANEMVQSASSSIRDSSNYSITFSFIRLLRSHWGSDLTKPFRIWLRIRRDVPEIIVCKIRFSRFQWDHDFGSNGFNEIVGSVPAGSVRPRQCFGSESGSALDPHSMGSWKGKSAQKMKKNLVWRPEKILKLRVFCNILYEFICLQPESESQ